MRIILQKNLLRLISALFTIKERQKVVNVIGLGYIGLPTALMMSAHGVEIVGTDYKTEIVDELNAGHITFKEKGLDELFHNALESGIKFTTEYQVADTYIVSVPTPYDKKFKTVDATHVVEALKDVLDVAPDNAVIVIESTISPGTIDKYVRPVVAEQSTRINIVHAPERIIPGNMVFELLHNNRTIGADDAAIGEKVKKLYASFCQGKITVTSIRTAEMTKVVENTFRDINIAYANELAKICHEGDMDVYEIIKIANQHPRVNILSPGPGVGGHCISVDPWFLVGDYPGLANIILQARKINDGMPRYVIHRISEIMKKEGIKDVRRVGLYGLTYKENVDDIRESPTLQMLKRMDDALSGGLVQVYDPFVEKDIVPNQHHSIDSFIDAIDMFVIMVGHDQIKDNMCKLKEKVVFDTRNICFLDGVYRL